MPKGISINIGINKLNINHYGSSFKSLNSCEKDAQDMASLALSQNFELFKSKVFDGSPKAKTVLAAIKETALLLKNGDFLLVTFSGHGSKIPDVKSDGVTPELEELFGVDQTWCLFDRQIIDDELAYLWSLFNEGVKILFISDSCHSGTVVALTEFTSETDITKSVEIEGEKSFAETTKIQVKNSFISIKSKNHEGGVRELNEPNNVFEDNEKIYRKVKKDLEDALEKKKNETGNSNAKSFKDFIKASVISITACRDDQKAQDGSSDQFNGVFTGALKQIWYGKDNPKPLAKGVFAGNYKDFFEKVKKETLKRNLSQEPNILRVGNANPAFENGPPFRI